MRMNRGLAMERLPSDRHPLWARAFATRPPVGRLIAFVNSFRRELRMVRDLT